MKPVTPYLFFDGNCREAMSFYKECFGGELELMTYGDAPPDSCGEGIQTPKDKIMHAYLKNDAFALMASDNPEGAPVQGDNISLSIECEGMAEVQDLFEALGAGGKVTMPLADTFWGAHFGMLIDKYGFRWMLSCPLKK